QKDIHIARPRLPTESDDPAHSEVGTKQDKSTAVEFEVGGDIQERAHAANIDELEAGEVDVEILSVAQTIFQLTVQDRASVDIEGAVEPQAGRAGALFDPVNGVLVEDDTVGSHDRLACRMFSGTITNPTRRREWSRRQI